MSQLNSSISNFEIRQYARFTLSRCIACWVVAGLVLIDILINTLFVYPNNPKVTDPSHLALYFEYGRSTEGQLTRMTRSDETQTAPITLTGWYNPLKVDEYPAKSSAASIVTIYGMSHAMRLGLALRRVTDEFVPRNVGAPGAPSNWSYGAFLRDRGGGKSRAVVLAFMSSTLAMTTTLSAMTWSFDLTMPYTTDRFYLDGARLGVVRPPYELFQEYVDTFYDPVKWAAALDIFAKHDALYDPLMMKANVLDHSSLFRLICRAYGQRLLRSARRGVLDERGYQADSEQVRVSQAIIHEFAIQARAGGMVPVIFLVNNLGYSDYLFQALSPVLRADDIPYLSSHTIVSPDDLRGYLPDSHFTDEVDNKLARALVEIIKNAK